MGFDLSKFREHLERVPKQFADKAVQIGWFPSAQYEDGTNVAYVATIHEFGAPEIKIPPRPFMRPAIDTHMPEWKQYMFKGVQAVAQGRRTADQVYEVIGGAAVGDIQYQIETGTYQPLSDITVLLRKWRRQGRKITGASVGEAAQALRDGTDSIAGVNADPLRDTGLMVATITHTVGKPE